MSHRVLLCVCVHVALALRLRVEWIQCFSSLAYPSVRLHYYPYVSNVLGFSIGPCSDRERESNTNESHMHPISAALKPGYGVGSLATHKGGYGYV